MPYLRLATSLFVIASTASAQDRLVVEVGDALPLGDNVQSILNYAVGSGGDWVARVRTDNADPLRRDVLLVNGHVVLRRGDPVGMTGNTVAGAWDQLEVNRDGNVAALGQVHDPRGEPAFALFVDGVPVLTDGDTIGSTEITRIDQFSLGDDGSLSATVALGPSVLGSPSSIIDLDLSASPPVLSLRIRPGYVYSDGSVVRSANGVWLRPGGHDLTLASEQLPSGVVRSVLRTADDIEVATGDPSPANNEPWYLGDFLGMFRKYEINANGRVGVLARVGRFGTGPRIVAVDDVLFARAGDTVPVNGTSVLRQLDAMAFGLTENDRPVYTGLVGPASQPSIRERALFVGREPVLFEGMAALGTTIENLIVFSSAQVRPVSDNGAYTLLFAELADGRSGLLLRELGLGTSSCGPAVPNSTGQSGRITATGTGLAGGAPMRLVATQLPPQQFGLFVVGDTSNSVMPPGSSGVLCVGGSIGRFNESLSFSGVTGQLEYQVDTTALPVGPGTAIQPGQTWYFQCWFRDGALGATSNFTDAVAITFD